MSLDYFALLEEPRRPWIDPEPLRSKFLRLSAECHPDRVHEQGAAEKQQAAQHYTVLNAGYQCLRDTKERLAHLLELESGQKSSGIEQVPPDMMDLFMTVGQMNREVSQFLTDRAKVTSPLLKAQWFEQALGRAEQVQALLGSLAARRGQLEDRLRQLNEVWTMAPPIGHPERAAALPLAELQQGYRLLSYLNRWSAQLQEQSLQLTL